MTKRVYVINADENKSVQLRATVCSNETGEPVYSEQNINYPGDMAELTLSGGLHIRIDEVEAPDGQ